MGAETEVSQEYFKSPGHIDSCRPWVVRLNDGANSGLNGGDNSIPGFQAPITVFANSSSYLSIDSLNDSYCNVDRLVGTEWILFLSDSTGDDGGGSSGDIPGITVRIDGRSERLADTYSQVDLSSIILTSPQKDTGAGGDTRANVHNSKNDFRVV